MHKDTRWEDTEERIIQAALEIVRGNPDKKVSVSDICNKANTDRKSFYNHFKDIFALFDTIMIRNSEKMRSELITGDKPLNETFFIPVLRHIKRSIILHRALMGQIRRFPVKYFLFDILYEKVKRKCNERGITDENEIMYHCVFIQAGGMMCIKRWLDNDCNDSPETVSRILYENIIKIMENSIPEKLLEPAPAEE